MDEAPRERPHDWLPMRAYAVRGGEIVETESWVRCAECGLIPDPQQRWVGPCRRKPPAAA